MVGKSVAIAVEKLERQMAFEMVATMGLMMV
jgi:hypothetical protein